MSVLLPSPTILTSRDFRADSKSSIPWQEETMSWDKDSFPMWYWIRQWEKEEDVVFIPFNAIISLTNQFYSCDGGIIFLCCTCRAPNSIISSSVQSMSSKRIAQRACSYNCVKRTVSYYNNERIDFNFLTLGIFFYTHLNQTRLPWDPYHGKCSIWNKAIFCHSLVFPAALVNEMNPATSREQKNTYIKDEMWIIIRLCLFLCCTWCGYVFCPPHWLAGRV